MTLARAMDIFTVLEQPAHESTGGMELLPAFRTMADKFQVPCLVSSTCVYISNVYENMYMSIYIYI